MGQIVFKGTANLVNLTNEILTTDLRIEEKREDNLSLEISVISGFKKQ